MNLPPQGELLVILAKELGNKVYTKYMLQKKVSSQVLDKVQRLYKDYVHLLAKDTQVRLAPRWVARGRMCAGADTAPAPLETAQP